MAQRLAKALKKTAAEFEEVNKKTTLLSQGIEKTGKEFKRLSRATKISKESLKEKNETVKISRDKLKGLDSGLIKTTRSTKKLSDEQARLKHNLKITSRPEVPIKHLNKELPKAAKNTSVLSEGMDKLGGALVGAIGYNLINRVVSG